MDRYARQGNRKKNFKAISNMAKKIQNKGLKIDMEEA